MKSILLGITIILSVCACHKHNQPTPSKSQIHEYYESNNSLKKNGLSWFKDFILFYKKSQEYFYYSVKSDGFNHVYDIDHKIIHKGKSKDSPEVIHLKFSGNIISISPLHEDINSVSSGMVAFYFPDIVYIFDFDKKESYFYTR